MITVSKFEFGDVEVPFAKFSSSWDEATGETKDECSDDNPQFCPSVDTLLNIQTMTVWGEGVEGTVSLDIQTISAVGCSSGIYAKLLASTGVLSYTAKAYQFVKLVIAGAAVSAMSSCGEVPPITNDAEVSVLRSEVIEMRRIVAGLKAGGMSLMNPRGTSC